MKVSPARIYFNAACNSGRSFTPEAFSMCRPLRCSKYRFFFIRHYIIKISAKIPKYTKNIIQRPVFASITRISSNHTANIQKNHIPSKHNDKNHTFRPLFSSKTSKRAVNSLTHPLTRLRYCALRSPRRDPPVPSASAQGLLPFVVMTSRHLLFPAHLSRDHFPHPFFHFLFLCFKERPQIILIFIFWIL